MFALKRLNPYSLILNKLFTNNIFNLQSFLHYAYISDNYALQLNHIIVKIHHSFTKQQIVHVCLLKSMACSISQDMRLESALKKVVPNISRHFLMKLPDNFQMSEHSWPCRFHIKFCMISHPVKVS
jgi:hypothetical protein